VVGQNNDQIFDISPSVTITKQEYLRLTRMAAYWKGQHKQAILREEILKKTIEEQKAGIRDLNKRLFGKKSKKKVPVKTKVASNLQLPSALVVNKKAVRELHPGFKSVEEPVDFSTTPTCPDCGTPYIYDSSKESEIIEVEVKAYTRRIIRETLKKNCSCKGIPNFITAPMPPKVIPKSQYRPSNYFLSKK